MQCTFCQKNQENSHVYELLCCRKKTMCWNCLFTLHFYNEKCVFCQKEIIVFNKETGFFYNSGGK